MTCYKKLWKVMAWTVLSSLIAVGEETTPKEELAVPSEKDVKAFVTKAKLTSDSKETIELQVKAKPAVLPKRMMAVYREKGKIPIAISVDMSSNKETKEGVEKHSIFEGKANIVVVNKDGEIVSKKTEDLSALCPS